MQLSLTGANIKIYVNNVVYPFVEAITLDIDYGEQAFFGIDSPFAQEIAPTKITVRGSVKGLRVKLSGGLQALNMRPLNLITEIAANPYITIRIMDRFTNEDIIFLEHAKVTSEHHTIAVKRVYELNFDFQATIPLFALDRS